MPFCATRFDFDKFKSACTDVKQNIQSRLNQWTEYESQHDKLVNWLNECEANLKTYNVKASLEEKVQQLDRFKVCKATHFFLFYPKPGIKPGFLFSLYLHWTSERPLAFNSFGSISKMFLFFY